MKPSVKNQLEKRVEWPEIKSIIKKLSKEGFLTVVAGGAVRDALLNKIPKDIDLATSARPEQVLKIFPHAKGAFTKYGVVALPLKTKKTIEITRFRKDSDYKDGRRPSSVSYSNIKEDALRRDFTVNALFYDPQTNKIIDFTGGLKDLQSKTLRAVGLANKRFEEDHLRAMRALRLAHQLDFQIEEKTGKSIPLFAKKIKKISKERILEELVKMFSKGDLGPALKSLKDHKLFPSVFPSLKKPLKSKHLRDPFDFWNKAFSFCKEPAFFWTAIGLPLFHSHTKDFTLFLKSLLVSNAELKKSLSYLKAVQTLTNRKSSFTEQLKALNGQKRQTFELTDFWLKSQGLKTSFLRRILREFEKRERAGKLPVPLVKGSDLLKLSPVPPKQQFSSILNKAFEYQMEQPKAGKSEILRKTKQRLNKPSA